MGLYINESKAMRKHPKMYELVRAMELAKKMEDPKRAAERIKRINKMIKRVGR